MIRHLPPVYSPLSLRALGRGLASALGQGEPHAALDRLLRREFEAERVVLTDSGTSALRLALEAVGAAEPGRPIAFPAYACYDLASAALGAGCRVLLYDVDPATLGPDWASLERALEAGAAAAVVVHLFGIPVDLDRVRGLTRPRGIPVIEDAAQAVGARWQSQPAGSLGDLSVLSFGRGKGWTGGGGGALLLRAAFAKAADGRRPTPGVGWGGLARSGAQWLLGRPALYGLPAALPFLGLGETHYRPPHGVGPLPRSAAGMLLATWPLLQPEIARRRENAARLGKALGGISSVGTVQPVAGAQPSWLRFPLRILAGGRDQMARRLARLGIAVAYPLSLAELEPWRGLVVNRETAFAGAGELARSLLTAPVHSLVSPAELGRLEHFARITG